MHSDPINHLLPPLPCAASLPEPHTDTGASVQQQNQGSRHIRAGQGAALPADFYGNGIMETST
jgi:hypothetical protein